MTSPSDWLLLALAHREGRKLTPVQVQKVMFLLGKEMPKIVGADFYKFVPYNYGPFDPAIYRNLEALAEREMVLIEGAGAARSYSVTPLGLHRAKALARDADPKGIEYLRAVVDWAASLSFTGLVRAIYRDYPEFKENSVFSD